MWSRGLTWRSQVRANPIPIPHPTNLALFGHIITLYRFNQGAHTIAGSSNRSRNWAPPGPLILTTGLVLELELSLSKVKCLVYCEMCDFIQRKPSIGTMGGATGGCGGTMSPHFWDQRGTGYRGAVQWKRSLLLQQTVFITSDWISTPNTIQYNTIFV